MSATVMVATASSSVPAAGAGTAGVSAAGAVAHAASGSNRMIAKRTYMGPPEPRGLRQFVVRTATLYGRTSSCDKKLATAAGWIKAACRQPPELQPDARTGSPRRSHRAGGSAPALSWVVREHPQ